MSTGTRAPRPHFMITVLVCMSACSACIATAGERPNIIFIFSDDHGWQAISAYGSNRNRTPHLDRIAAEGMRFDRCYVTNSICAPSRAAILTGKHCHLNGNTTNERLFDNRQPMFPRMLQAAGYQTVLIGKHHLRTEPVGFDHWDTLINQGTYYNPWMIRNGEKRRLTGYTTDLVTDMSIEWLREQRDPDKPFMLMLQHKAPHRLWDPGPDHLTSFNDGPLPEPPTLFDDWKNRSSALFKAEMTIAHHLNEDDLHLQMPRWQLNEEQMKLWEAAYGPENQAFREANLTGDDLTRWKYQRFAKDYLRCVQSIDDGIGRLLDYLDESGLARNTIVIYNSDQGWFLGEHGMYDKRWMYEESFRTPLLVRWPGVTPAGSVNTDLVQNIDFAPTFLDLAGAAIPADMQGVSIRPLLEGRTPSDWRRSVYYHFYEDLGAHRVPRHYGVRTDRHKLIHYYRLGEWELFDLVNDPDELVSVYDDPAYAKVRAELEVELKRLRAHYRVTDHADVEYDAFNKLLEGRRSFLAALGRGPGRAPRDAETLSVSESDGVRHERVAYKVGGLPIEADLLIPLGRAGRLPAVVTVHPGAGEFGGALGPEALLGESGDGPAYDLCRRGVVVLVPERRVFGTRRPQRTDESAQAIVETRAAMAKRLLDNNSTLLLHEVEELWAAHEYLTRRPEVHAKRVGVVGYGEGGTLAAVLAMVNEECWATVAVEGVRRFPAESDKPSTALQVGVVCDLLDVPALRAWGDMDRALTLIYPRSMLVIGSREPDASLFAAAREQYRESDYGDRIATKRADSSDPLRDETIRARVGEWIERRLARDP